MTEALEQAHSRRPPVGARSLRILSRSRFALRLENGRAALKCTPPYRRQFTAVPIFRAGNRVTARVKRLVDTTEGVPDGPNGAGLGSSQGLLPLDPPMYLTGTTWRTALPSDIHSTRRQQVDCSGQHRTQDKRLQQQMQHERGCEPIPKHLGMGVPGRRRIDLDRLVPTKGRLQPPVENQLCGHMVRGNMRLASNSVVREKVHHACVALQQGGCASLLLQHQRHGGREKTQAKTGSFRSLDEVTVNPLVPAFVLRTPPRLHLLDGRSNDACNEGELLCSPSSPTEGIVEGRCREQTDPTDLTQEYSSGCSTLRGRLPLKMQIVGNHPFIWAVAGEKRDSSSCSGENTNEAAFLETKEQEDENLETPAVVEPEEESGKTPAASKKVAYPACMGVAEKSEAWDAKEEDVDGILAVSQKMEFPDCVEVTGKSDAYNADMDVVGGGEEGLQAVGFSASADGCGIAAEIGDETIPTSDNCESVSQPQHIHYVCSAATTSKTREIVEGAQTAIQAASAPAKCGEEHFRRAPSKGDCKREHLSGQAYGTSKETLRCYLHQLTRALSDLLQHVGNEKLQEKGTSASLPRPREGSTPTTPHRILLSSPKHSLHEDREEQMTRAKVSVSQAAPLGADGAGGLMVAGVSPSPPLPQKVDGRPRPSVAFSPLCHSEQQPVRLQASASLSRRAAAATASVQSATARRRRYAAGGNRDTIATVQLPLLVSRSTSSSGPLNSAVETPGCSSLFRRTACVCARRSTPRVTSPSAARTTIAATRVPEPCPTSWTSAAPRPHAGKAAFRRLTIESFSSPPAANLLDANRGTRYFSGRTTTSMPLPRSKWSCLSSAVCEKETWTPSAHQQKTGQSEHHQQIEGWMSAVADATGGVLATAAGGTELHGRGAEAASEWRSANSMKEDSRRAKGARSGSRTQARSCSVRWRTDNEEGSGMCEAELPPSEDWASESCPRQGTSKQSTEWDEDVNREVDAGKLVSLHRVKQQLRMSGTRMQPRIVETMGGSVVVPTNRRRRADKKPPETSTRGGPPQAEREDIEELGKVLEETEQAAGSPRSQGQQTATSGASAEPGSPFSVEGEAERSENASPLASVSPPPEGCTQPLAVAAVEQSHTASRRSSEGDATAEEEGLTNSPAREISAAAAAAAAAGARRGHRGADRRMLLQDHPRHHLLDTLATPTAAAAQSEAKSSPCLSHAALTPSPVTPKPRQPQEIDFSFGGSAGATLPARSCPAATLLRRRSSSFITCLGAYLNAGAQPAAAPTPARVAPSAAVAGTALASAAAAGEPHEPVAEKGGRAAAGAAAASTPPPTTAPAATSATVRTPAAGATAAAASPRDKVVPPATVPTAGAAAQQQHRGLTLGEGGQQHASSGTKPRGSPTAGGQQQHVPLVLEEKCPLSPLPSPRSSLKNARRQLRLPDQQAAACFSRVSGVFTLCEQCGCGRAPPLQQHRQQPAVKNRTPAGNGEGPAGEGVGFTTPGARRPETAAADALPASAAVEGEIVAGLTDMASLRGKGAARARAAGTAETHVPAGTADAFEERTSPLRTTALAAAGPLASTRREGRGTESTGEDLSETDEKGALEATGEGRPAAASSNSCSSEGAVTAPGAMRGKVITNKEMRKKCGGLPPRSRGDRDESLARDDDPERETRHRVSQRKPDHHHQLRQQQTLRTKRRSTRTSSSKMRTRSSTWSSGSESTDSCELTKSSTKRSDAAAAATGRIRRRRSSTSSCSKPQRETQTVYPLVDSYGTRGRSSRHIQSAVDHWKADADSEGDTRWRGRPRQWGSCSSSSDEEEDHDSSRRTSWNSNKSCGTASRRGSDSRGAEGRSSRVTNSSSVRDEEDNRSSWTCAPTAQRRHDTSSLRAVKQDSDQLKLHKQQKELQLWRQERRKESVSTSAGLHSYRSAASMRFLSRDSVGGDVRQLQVSIGRVKNVYILGEEKLSRGRAFCVAYTQNDDLHSLIRRRKQRTRTVRVERESEHVFCWSFNEKVLLPYDPLQAGVRVAVLRLLFDEDLVDVAPALQDLHYQLLGVTPLLLLSCFSREEEGEQPAGGAGGKDEPYDVEEKQCWSLLCPDDPAASTGELEVRLRLLPACPAESRRKAAAGGSVAALRVPEVGEESSRKDGSSHEAHAG